MLDPNLIKNIYSELNSPFYAVFPAIFNRNFTDFYNAFKQFYSNIQIGYSIKTNYLPEIVLLAKKQGALAEVVSKDEYELAKHLKFTGKNIIFNGPVKTEKDIQYALYEGSFINLDSIEEVDLAIKIARQYSDQIFNVGLRINISVGDSKCSRLGIFVENGDLEEAFKKIKYTENLCVNGLHAHTSSMRSLESYKRRIKTLLDVVENFKDYIELEYVDLGGGFCGRMSESLKSQFNFEIPTYNDYAEVICTEMNAAFPDERVKLILEPGIAIDGNVMFFVCEALSIKQGSTGGFVNTNGSAQIIKPTMHSLNIPFLHIPRGHNTKRILNTYDIGGYTCMEHDIMYKRYRGSFAVGDLLIFENVGAYTNVLKPPFIRGMPKIVQITQDNWKIIHEQQTYKHFINTN